MKHLFFNFDAHAKLGREEFVMSLGQVTYNYAKMVYLNNTVVPCCDFASSNVTDVGIV